MTDTQDGGVDPRFDPRFQRGYDPEVHRTGAPRRPDPADAPVLRVTAPPITPPTARPAAPRVERRGEQPGAERPTSDDALPSDDAEPGEETDDETRRNPFLIALPVVSILLLALASALLVRNATPGQQGVTSSEDGVLDMVVAQLAYLAPQGLIAGAVVGLALWLALLAVSPRGRAR